MGLTNIGGTMDALGEKIGAYFGVTRCGFFEFNEAADEAVCEYDWHAKADDPSLVGEYRTADFYTDAGEFISTLRAGEAFVLGDGTADPRVIPANLAALDIRSFIVVPTHRAAAMPLIVLALNDNKPRDWSKDEIDLMREVTTRIWTRLERARAEQALAASEEKYRTLFENIDEGFCLLNILFDEAGEAHDYVFLEANPAFEKQSGLVGAVGGHIAELVPDMEPYWIRMMVQVARTGEPIRFEADVASMGRCFDLYAFSGGENKVAVVFNDITERKRREANLAFLAEVSVDLARLANIDETMDAVGAKVAAHLGLSACAFAELDGAADIATNNHGWHRSGMPSLLGTYRMEEFMAAEVVQDCRAGKAVVVSDVFADPRVNGEQYAALGIGSFASIPLMRDGVWGFLLVAYRPGPCNWREDEIDLMREIATRNWTRLERARAEAELHRSQERYQAFMQHSTEGIYRCELDRLIPVDMPVDEVLDFAYEHTYLAECNDAMARMYGHDSGKELEGARLGDLTPRTPENEAFLTAFLTNGFKLQGGESQEQHRDGHTVYFRNNLFGIVEDGFLVRVWGTQTDITAQHQAELDLRASLELYHLSSEASAGMLYDYDPYTDRIMRAGAVEAITGVPVAEVPELGSWWIERIHPEDLVAQLALVPDIIAARKENHMGEYRVRHAKGHWVHVMDKSRWIYDEAGTLIRMVGNTVDVSDRVRALAELHEENERKNEFIATLSHELRNPLAPLRTGIQLLGEPPYDEATTRPVVKMMERQVDHMVHLIEDLMDLNRISRGKIELRIAELDLHAPLLQALESVAPQMKAKGHTVVRELAGTPLIHMGDATRLAQVFGNLLENAAKYTAPGGTITVRTEVHGTRARITFIDNGGGIEAEDLPRVFGMFAQIRKDNEFAQGGIGIGLHIVKRLVEMHHGTIEVSSAGRGQGSAFTVSLPIAASLASTYGTVNASALAPLAPLRILLTDDNVDAANSLAMLLKKAGHEVEVAHNGASALEKGERSAPQVLVLDIGMPGMYGYDLCRRIRGTSWGASSYIIALTGWGQEDDRQKALEAGFDHHMVKPVGRKELEGALAAVGRTVVAG